MAKLIDLTGRRFGRLLVVSKAPASTAFANTSARWECRCDCGSAVVVFSAALRRGATKSCGCLDLEVKTKHGMYGTPTYRSWRSMIDRCANPRTPNYHLYGGRGIAVCAEWESFELFLRDMGERPKGTSLDRIDSDGPYSPENCRWATANQQQRNKRNNHLLTVDGETRCIAEWAEITGIQKVTIKARIRSGWSHREAVLKPVEPRKRRTTN